MEFDAFPGKRTAEAVSGVRLRPTDWLTIDAVGGSRIDFETQESRPVSELGLRIGGKKFCLTGRVDYAWPDQVSGFTAVEMEW